MKKRLPLLLSLLFTFQLLQAQHEQTYDYLEHLGKTWGFLKYFHSEVSDCFADWDDSLLDVIPAVMDADNDETMNQILFALLAEAGAMAEPTGELPEVPEELRFNLDTDWISNSTILSDPVESALLDVLDKFRPQNSCHVDEAWAGGNPVFDDDDSYYSGAEYPTLELRLLGLFRLWNTVRYFSPYNDIIDQDWEEVLPEFIPRVVEAANALDYHLALKEMTVRLDDAHNFFVSAPFFEWDGNFHPPFKVKFIAGETVITQVVSTQDVKVGDVIKRIDGEDIYERRAALMKYAHGGNQAVKNRNVNNLLLWGENGSFEMEIENENGTQLVNIERNNNYFSILNIQAENVPVMWDTLTSGGCHYGYVHMGLLEPVQIHSMFNQFADTDAIIFDIRNYPNGTLWTLVNYLFPDPIHIASFTVPDIRYPGTLNWFEETIGSGAATPYEGQLLILFDEVTQSQAEYTVMGLEQHPNSLKIGSTTAAADGNVTQVYLPGQIRAYFTGLGTFYPDQSPTQRIGILPDIELHPTIAGIREGRDELLEYAIAQCELVSTENLAEEKTMVSAFPSPFKEFLEIELEPFGQEVSLELLDIRGNMLRKELIEGTNRLRWNMTGLPSGTYLLRVINEQNIQTVKVVRQ